MKNRSFTILFFLLACSAALFLTNCQPGPPSCPGGRTTTNDLSEADLSKVPYTGFDTLYFLGNMGDTHIVAGGGKKYYYDTEAVSGGGPECPTNIITNNQACKIQFNAIRGDLNFTLLQQKANYRLTITVNNYPVSFIEGYVSIGIRNLSNPYYIDHLSINNHQYDTVRKLVPFIKPYVSSVDSTYTLLYNQTFGVLSVKSQKDNEEYTLLKK